MNVEKMAVHCGMSRTLICAFVAWLALCCVKIVSGSPDYDSLLQSLHRKIEDTFNTETDKDIKIKAGRLFKYAIAEDSSNDIFKLSEVGKSSLPSWLLYHEDNHQLLGVPTKQDIGIYKIQIETVQQSSSKDSVKYLRIEVVAGQETFQCKEKELTTGHVVLHGDMKNFMGAKRVKLLRKFSGVIDVSVHDILLQEGNGMDSETLDGASIAMAGPGDQTSGSQPGITLVWKVKCSTDVAGDRSIAMLKSYSASGAFMEQLGLPLVNWFVLMRRGRNRRAAGALGGTPVVTPSVKAPGGTPVPTPTPSLIIRSTHIAVASSPIVASRSTQVVAPAPTSSLPLPTAVATATTVQPTTQHVVPTTKPTTKPVATPPVVTPANRPPIKYISIDRLDTQAFQALQYFIPSNLFYDPDGDSLTLSLKMADADNNMVDVPSSYFVEYSAKHNSLFLLPEGNHVGQHQFYIQADDGKSHQPVHEAFLVVVGHAGRQPATTFNATLDLDFDKVSSSVAERVILAQKISQATDGKDYRRLRVLQFLRGSVIVEWGLHNVNFTCNSIEYITYREHLTGSGFRRKMADQDVAVTKTGIVSQCPAPFDPEVAGTRDAASWWERIMIPVIVIVIVLIIIALILCCLYRRRRKYIPNDGEKNGQLLSQKKPVIFLEEYEEKPDFVSLQPLVLPNEKPPISDNMEPRSGSPGPDSSTVSTESDEKAPLAPNSPKEARHGYNAPPPYSAH